MGYREEKNIDRAVLISGRLRYSGLSGATFGAPKTVENFVHFDATNQLYALVEESRLVSGAVIVVLWDDECSQSILLNLKALGAEVEVIRDRFPLATSPGSTPAKYKQFGPVLAGLERLNRLDIEWALRVRVDQWLDVPKALGWVQDHGQEGNSCNRVHWPLSPERWPLFLRDFYFGGPTETLLNIFRYFMVVPEFSPNVHLDLFGKSAYLLSNLGRRRHPLAFFPRHPNVFTRDQWNIAADLWQTMFSSFPKSVWESVRWRGSDSLLGVPPEGALFEDQAISEYWTSDPAATAGKLVNGSLTGACYSWESYLRFRYGLNCGSVLYRLENRALRLRRYLRSASE